MIMEESVEHSHELYISGIPDVPEGLTAVPDTTSILLTWSPPFEYHGPITHYQVAYHHVAHDGVTVANASSGPILTVTGLKPENQYSFKVRAVTTAGAGEYSSVVTATTTTLCMYIFSSSGYCVIAERCFCNLGYV